VTAVAFATFITDLGDFLNGAVVAGAKVHN
jgi:hypothetical protein